jgi:hypothetical protein
MGQVEKYRNLGRKVRKCCQNIGVKANSRRDLEFMESLVADVVKNVDGRRVMKEGEDDEEVMMTQQDLTIHSP